MRRLITLISAGRNRTIVIRRELPRTKDAGWAMEPYRIKGRRILLSVSPRPVTSTVALPYAEASMRRSARTKPAIPSSQPMGFSHRRRVPSRPSGSERQRAAASRRAALTGGAGARRSKWREWQAWSWLSGLRFCLEFGLRADGNGPDEAQQLTADRSHNLRFVFSFNGELFVTGTQTPLSFPGSAALLERYRAGTMVRVISSAARRDSSQNAMPEFVNRNSQMRSNCSSRKRYP